jgi:soluble lytic murein transglycosylase-like protein
MVFSLVRYSALAALVLGALAQPALARQHSTSLSAGSNRHHHHHHAARPHRAHYQHTAYINGQRLHAATAAAWQQGAPLGAPFQSAFAAPAQPWQHGTRQRMVRGAMPAQQAFGSPSFAQWGAYPQSAQPHAGRRTRGAASGYTSHGGLDGLVAQQAAANGVPASLVHRVIMRESGYNSRAVSAGNYGLMQIRLGTARAMGYTGSAAGLLNPATNMTYAVRYLAGAYRAAGGDENRAVALYARGYYHQAKAQGFSPYSYGGATTAFGPPAYGYGTPASSYGAPYTSLAFQTPYGGSFGRHAYRHRRHAV